MALAAAATLSIPVAVQVQASHWSDRAVQRFIAAPTHPREGDLRLLRALSFTANLDPMVRAWSSSSDPDEKQALADTYAGLTGSEIQQAAWLLGD
jgi:hypothetical protein